METGKRFSDEFVQAAIRWSVETGEDIGKYIEEHWSAADYDKYLKHRFKGETFQCRFCECDIKWPGMCTPCSNKDHLNPLKPMTERMAALGVPSEMTGCSWENWKDPDIEDDEKLKECLLTIEQIKEWQGEPPLLFLSGMPGIGKTHMAVATLDRRIRTKGAAGITWLRYPKACEMMRDGLSLTQDPLKDTLRSRRLLVIDDFGQGHTLAWTGQEIFAVICDRIDNGKPTIITTNLLSDDIKAISPALCSRLNSSLTLTSKGMTDRRAGA